jgi:hypothetical protein
MNRDDFKAMRTAGGWVLHLPLGPSVNRRTIPVRGVQRLSPEARQYLHRVGSWCWGFKYEKRFAPIDRRVDLRVWHVLPRRSCDQHNYTKIQLDALERGGLVTNDRLITPVYSGVWYDTQRTCFAVELPC